MFSLFLDFLTSLLSARKATFLCCSKKKRYQILGENTNKREITTDSTEQNELFSTSSQIKSKKEDEEKMNDAAAATFDAVSDGVSDVKDTVGKYVQFNANRTNFFIKLRKNLDVRFPGN